MINTFAKKTPKKPNVEVRRPGFGIRKYVVLCSQARSTPGYDRSFLSRFAASAEAVVRRDYGTVNSGTRAAGL